MTPKVQGSRPVQSFLSTLVWVALSLTAGSVAAQTETPAAEPPSTPPPAESATPVQVVAPAPLPVTVAQADPPTVSAPVPTVSEAAPPTEEKSKPLSVSVWGRIGNVLQGTTDASKLNDLSQNAEVDLLMSGQIHKNVKWTADFVATYGPGGNGGMAGNAAILDLIGQLEFHDAFNIWFGRMLVPSDRSNFAGPWFMAPWNYPGFYPTLGAPVGPRQGPFGRNDGATVWGQFGGGVFKYYASVFDLHEPSSAPLFSGRINISLLNPEPGYYHSATYYGGKDILALGLGAQFKKDGSASAGTDAMGMPLPVMSSDYTGVNADLLYEKNLGGAGVLDLEGAFYVFDGDFELFDNHFFALASYLLPTEIGIGRLQPLVRFQSAGPKDGSTRWRMIDAQVGYAIAEYAARLALGFQNSQAGTVKSNAVFLGLQLQK